MRVLEEIAESPFLISRLNLNSTASGYGWVDKCHGFLHNTVLVAASLFFVAYLAYEAKKSLSKLSNRRSYIMIAYYGCLWLVTLLNLVWCCLQGWECTPGKEVVWNLLTLVTTSGMLFLEVSLVAFLFQGNYASGSEALTRTFLISGFVIALDLLFKTLFLFGFGVPLFIDNNENGNTFKWGLWIIHKLLLTGVYGMIFLMYNSRRREKLPARPAFFKYIAIMFALYGLYLVASVFTANGAHFWILVVWDHECFLPRFIPSSSLLYFSRRLFPGRRSELGECILLRDEGRWILRF